MPAERQPDHPAHSFVVHSGLFVLSAIALGVGCLSRKPFRLEALAVLMQGLLCPCVIRQRRLTFGLPENLLGLSFGEHRSNFR